MLTPDPRPGSGPRTKAIAAVMALVVACLGIGLLLRPGASPASRSGGAEISRPAVSLVRDESGTDPGGGDPGAAQTASERRGKALYETGIGSSGRPVPAVLGASGTEVTAAVVRCVNCHGQDGRGVPEGGIVPPRITWEELTRPYGATTAGGRRRPAYTEALVRRSIGMGIDSAGQTLQAAMPRYRLSLREADDLLAYLKRLGRTDDAGITPTTIRVASILPPERGSEAMSRAVAQALRAFFDEVNADGGLYGRRFELRLVPAAEAPEDRPAQAARLIEAGDVFALVGCSVAGAEAEIAEQVQEAAVPLVGALTLYPRDGPPTNRYVFHIDGGILGEALTLIQYVTRDRDPGRAWTSAVLVAPAEPLRAVARAAVERIRAEGGAARLVEWDPAADPRALVRDLVRDRVEVLLLLTPAEEALPVLRVADEDGWSPRVLLPGSLASPAVFDIPGRFETDTSLALCSLVPLGPDGTARHRALAARAGLPAEHVSAQMAALSAAAVLVEALARAGRDVRREALIDQLDRLAGFATGFSPPLTYHPDRRIGARGGFILGVRRAARAFERRSGWVEPEG